MCAPRSLHTVHSVRTAHSVRALAGLLLTAALALAGCSAGVSGGDSAKPAAGAAKPAADAAESAAGAGRSGAPGGAAGKAESTGTPVLAQNAIIRTASLTLVVKNVPEALAAARTTALDAGGYVGQERTSRDGDGHERTRIVLRVPTAKYDEVLTGLQGTGKLVHRTAKAEDVTDQVVDVDSRITSQRASVDRIRALMDRATRMSDIVSLEGELSRRQADLEALLARQASLKDRTSLATITLSLSGTPVRKASGDGEPGFTDALAGGWQVFVTGVRWITLALGAVLPFAAFTAVLVLLWLRVVRPRLPRRTQPAPAATALGPLPSARPAPESAEEADRG
ncbi:DUF4349 domain-containing protein [Streptomyces sp. MUM 16J]|uniref:DUF4349 domain-containing protein n=1 Tax=Streptomyces sp. MUM 16J TaxID=2791988 RepID=UPI001F04423D|nr:DUF4349 domain-containing protein [Streptomyces sp. MUM 16J]MCH0561023.1 DUF4349 domain-containing protein [Streptomyces sp. MUM 16J]